MHNHEQHGHSHSHSHSHNTGRILNWSFAATLVFVAVEAVAGWQAHSLALLSDAGHNFTDALALLLAAFGYYLQSKPADESRTYGYHRAGVLAAFVNVLTLVALSVWILWESYQRLRAPEAVSDEVMLWIAVLGLAVNSSIMWGLRRRKDADINIRAAFIHMLGDAIGSVGIMIGAIVIHYTGWLRIDPILSAVIAVLILWTAWDIVRESLNILLEGLPRGISLDDVTGAIRGVAGVTGVHDLHIWSLGSSIHALSCHVQIADIPPSESGAILDRIHCVLEERFAIHHTTIQFEHERCALPENGCLPPATQQPHHHQH